MSIFKYYPIKELVKIVVYEKYESPLWYWQEESRSFFGLFREKAGFRHGFDDCVYSEKELPKNLCVEDGKVYKKPHVKLIFRSKDSETEYYNSVEELHEANEELMRLSLVHWIPIKN